MSLFDTGIRPVIDEYLKKKSEEERDYGDYWSASSAGYCMRYNIMKRLGVPAVPEIEEDKARSTRVFEAGHIFHEWMQRLTKDAGISIAQETKLQDEELMIIGHFDDLVLISGKLEIEDDPGDAIQYEEKPDHLILYDYKTQNSRAFTWQKKEDRGMSHLHKMQLGTYMYMLRSQWMNDGYNPYTKDMPSPREARILKISKDDLRMEEDQLLWTPELEKEIYQYWSTLNGYWKKRVLPKCTCLDFDGGWFGKRTARGKVFNPYFYNDQPCSEEWYRLWKESNDTPGTT